MSLLSFGFVGVALVGLSGAQCFGADEGASRARRWINFLYGTFPAKFKVCSRLGRITFLRRSE